ncbi:acyl dehydratase [Yoonia sp. 208BN28-4]|uniref:acyl dehydratase n=1 Tax=Yoonia sp. 208BN28-4 TaxID=3126505 RepID=UPI00309A38CB
MADELNRTQTQTDVMDPARARALQATLGQTPTLESGDHLPPFAHHIYFWDPQPPDHLGRDGHPATGTFIPDLGLPRRMWAAGRLVFHKPLLTGVRAEKTSMIESVTRKDGRSGPLAFVRIRHDIKQRHGLAISEWQDLVYRPDDAPAGTPPVAPLSETHATPVSFTTTQLFRYSALTFNGHRIHYDEDYARQTEGYDGLVVHGPLLAHLLMDLAQRHLGTLKTFAYRATGPLMHTDTADLCWKGGTLWVRRADGRQAMEAQAT